MLEKYPNKEDWYRVIFSDEVAMGHRVKSGSYESLGKDTVRIVYKKQTSQLKKIRRNFTAGPGLVRILSLIYRSTTLLVTAMVSSPNRLISIRSLSRM